MVRPKLTGLAEHSTAIWTNVRASVGFQATSSGLHSWALLPLQSNPDEMTTLLSPHLLQLQLIEFMTIGSPKLVAGVWIKILSFSCYKVGWYYGSGRIPRVPRVFLQVKRRTHKHTKACICTHARVTLKAIKFPREKYVWNLNKHEKILTNRQFVHRVCRKQIPGR